MLRRITAFIALFVLGAAEAQAAPRPYPSLAKRPAELPGQPQATPSPAPAPQAAPDPALAATVDTLSQKAVASDGAFNQKLADGRRSVSAAGSAAPVSEAWVAAQMAISALDAARYESIASLASLDTLHVDRMDNADGARVAADLATIDPARIQVLALVDAQNDALDALRSALARP